MKNTTAERWLMLLFPLIIGVATKQGIKPFDINHEQFEFKDGNEIVIISIKTKPYKQ